MDINMRSLIICSNAILLALINSKNWCQASSNVTDLTIPKVKLSDTWKAPIILPATEKHTGTILWFQGMAEDDDRWLLEFGNHSIHQPYMKVVFAQPNSTGNRNLTCWYKPHISDMNAIEDEAGIDNSVAYIHELIEDEIKNGTPSDRIILGGLSQGGALALRAGLSFPKKLAGIMTLSAWLPHRSNFYKVFVPANKYTPIVQAHAVRDLIISYDYGLLGASIINKFADNHEFRTYKDLDGDMDLPAVAFKDLKEFFKKHLPPR